MKKRHVAKAGDPVKHLAAVESETFRALMALVEHCAVRMYDDGDPREPGWFMVRTTGSAWQVVVKDPDSATSFTATQSTLDGALETAALLLACDEAPWEPDSYLAAAKARKKR